MDGFDLNDALARFPLPDDVDDLVVNRTQLAKALNTSDNTITKWLGRGMPCEASGSNGQGYEFQLSHCYAWRMATLEAEGEARRRADAAAAQLALSFMNPDEEDADQAALTPRQIREFAEADMQRNRAAELRGELVRAARVRELFEDVLVAFRTQVMTLVDFAEREFALDPKQVDALQKRTDQALLDARARIEATIPRGEVAQMRRTEAQGASAN